MKFRYLFSPLKIGPIEVRNRIVFSGHATLLTEGGLPSEKTAYYLAERAKGGVGLIVTELTTVHPSSIVHRRFGQLGYEESCIPAFKRVADAVHEHGAKIFCQIWHGGRQQIPITPWAPSPIPCPINRIIPHEMDIDEIKDVIEGYARTARNMVAADFDGVELHGAHGYLIQQFLSPVTNQRTDEYGGSKEKRLRFAQEVIAKVREAVGPDKALGLRLSSDELLEGGLSLEEMKEISPILTSSGKLDYLSLSLGTHQTKQFMVAPMSVPPGFQLPFTTEIRRSVDIPVVAAGRINDPIQADKILEEGSADLVAMTRALICDPELPNKALADRSDDIRSCVSCNQGCFRRVSLGLPISCLQDPTVGKEKTMGIGTLQQAKTKKNVLIIGGGPAGLKAALTATQRGHRVTLIERSQKLGGQVLLASKIPHHEDFEGIVRYLILQLKKAGVKVVLGTEASATTVVEYAPDVVIVATGAEAIYPAIQGAVAGRIITAADVLERRVDLASQQRILVIDEDGYDEGVGVAELLAGQGKKVQIITTLPYVAERLTMTMELPFLYKRLSNMQVEMIPLTAIRKVNADSAVVYNIYSEEERVLSADVIVYAGLKKANDAIYRSLKGKVKEIYLIGDCLSPRKAIDAIREGDQTARRI